MDLSSVIPDHTLAGWLLPSVILKHTLAGWYLPSVIPNHALFGHGFIDFNPQS